MWAVENVRKMQYIKEKRILAKKPTAIIIYKQELHKVMFPKFCVHLQATRFPNI